jgi:serine protease Do
MSLETNKLVGKAGRFGAPAGAAVALVLAATFFFHHNGVHAAMISSPAPLDDNSVSALVALDNAVEAVAARVSPAVVNIQVTSRGSSEHQTVPSAAARCSGRNSRRLSMESAAA